jgi:hypothetical protein
MSSSRPAVPSEAWHEAGHAVLALAIGRLALEGATIVPNGRMLGEVSWRPVAWPTDPRECIALALVFAAGPIAEARWSTRDASGWGDDAKALARLLEFAGDAQARRYELERIGVSAGRILAAHERCVAEIADALSALGSIPSGEFLTLIFKAHAPRDSRALVEREIDLRCAYDVPAVAPRKHGADAPTLGERAALRRHLAHLMDLRNRGAIQYGVMHPKDVLRWEEPAP